MGAGRYQLVISTLLTLCSAAGLLGIGRNIVVGMDALAWLSFALMVALAWYARWMIHRMPLLDEAIIRVQDAPAWSDLSPARRRFLWWFDWPLFTEIRNGEVRRLFSEPLVSVQFVSGSAILQPLEEQHCEQYFLNKIAGAVSIHGLTVSNVKQGVFGARLDDSRVELQCGGCAPRIWDHLQSKVTGNRVQPLRHFIDTVESGYIGTLSDAQRLDYYMWRR